MKISCCWLYAISKYGYPPSISDTYRALEDMQRLGFKYVELEGVREENLRAVYEEKENIKIVACVCYFVYSCRRPVDRESRVE